MFEIMKLTPSRCLFAVQRSQQIAHQFGLVDILTQFLLQQQMHYCCSIFPFIRRRMER